MNRIQRAFAGKKAFIAFLTGGDPDVETTEKLIIAMAENGVDAVEIGIPFSDPVAEGPVIQAADIRALSGGCTVDKLFDMAARLRTKIKIPLLFMTYANPIVVYGADRFMKNCAASGIDGIIVPDLPFEERGEISESCKKYGIVQISMIAPTSRERIKQIAKDAEGFIYCVSSLGVTGVRDKLTSDVGELIRQTKSVTDTPCAVGFGISTPKQARDMAAMADGIIIGSAIVRIIAENGRNSLEPVIKYVRDIRSAL